MKKETNIILKELNKMSLLDYVKHLTKIKNLIDGLKNGLKKVMKNGRGNRSKVLDLFQTSFGYDGIV